MNFTDEDIHNYGINQCKEEKGEFIVISTHIRHKDIDYIHIKAHDNQCVHLYSTVIDVSFLDNYKSIISDIKTLYDILQNPEITKEFDKNENILAYSVILSMGFNTIKLF